MSYGLYDADEKYLGDFATAMGLLNLRKYAAKVKAVNLAGFLDKGAALVTTALVEEIKALRPADLDVKDTIQGLLRMLDAAELCVIISDGAND